MLRNDKRIVKLMESKKVQGCWFYFKATLEIINKNAETVWESIVKDNSVVISAGNRVFAGDSR